MCLTRSSCSPFLCAPPFLSSSAVRWHSNVWAYLNTYMLHNGYSGEIGTPGNGILDGHEHYFMNNKASVNDCVIYDCCEQSRCNYKRGLLLTVYFRPLSTLCRWYFSRMIGSSFQYARDGARQWR